MLGDEERTERTVEHVGGAHCPWSVERPLMPNDAVGKHMMSEILTGLVGIATLGLGRIKQREAQRAVIGLVPSISGVVEQGDAIGPRTVGEVGPLMGIDLEQIVLVVATAHMSQTNVIGSLLVCHIQRELGLEQGIERAPVDHVLDIYPVGQVALIEMDALHDIRFAIALAHDKCLTERTLLDGELDIIAHWQGTFVEGGLLDLPSRPPC